MTNPILHFVAAHRFLSNFHAVPHGIRMDGVYYPTVENAYQAAKTTDPGDRLRFIAISPGAAKARGRHLDLREDWEEMKLKVMEDFLRQKFMQEPLHDLLRATGNRVLSEGNYWHDLFWGKCYCAKHAGRGDDRLGELLMKIRSELK